MIADTSLTAATIRPMDRPTAARWARRISNWIIAGRVALLVGDETVAMLEVEGLFEEASWVRSAVNTRSATMRSRGFTSVRP